MYERALAILETHFVNAGVEVLRNVNNHSSVLKDLGQFEVARYLFERALAIKETYSGKEIVEVAKIVYDARQCLTTFGPFYVSV